MCGLWAYFLRHGYLFDSSQYVRNEPWKHANANRGPDRSTEVQGADYHLMFHRLAINDLSLDGDQPFIYEWDDETVLHVMCNGEIYNYKRLVDKFNLENKMKGYSDCEIIGHLLEYFDGDVGQVANELDGEYAFVARMEFPDGNVRIVAARDRYGVRPLYYASFEKGIIFSSMLGGIVGIDDAKGHHFPPGHTYSETLTDPQRNIEWKSFEQAVTHPFPDVTSINKMYLSITNALIDAVKVRLTSERPIGFLLSGGLDSSLVVAIATKLLGIKAPNTFTIGFDRDATDVKYARIVATFLGSKHTEIIIDPSKALEDVRDVIKSLETYDITTIRASIPQYLLAKHISEKTKIRVIMNGDGSDEVACGYIYNYYAPSPEAADADSKRLLSEIHCFDGLRVDRTLGAHGLEARLPFLDPMYVSEYHRVAPHLRVPSKENNRMEKQFLRDAFATLYPGLLPNEVLYRQKEAFSDGVSKATIENSWFNTLQSAAKEMNMSESEWYKDIFDFYFPGQRHILPHYWFPPREWTQSSDPSARTLSVYHK